jgi:hypothetical protein
VPIKQKWSLFIKVWLTPSLVSSESTKFKRLLEKSEKRVEKSIDVVTFLRNHAKLKILEELLFTKA